MITNFKIFEDLNETNATTLNDMISKYISWGVDITLEKIENFIKTYKINYSESDRNGVNILMHTIDKNDLSNYEPKIFAVVKLLLEDGADKYINQTDIYKNNALIFSSYQKYLSVLELLIEYGSTWNQIDDLGSDFLSYLTVEERSEIIKKYPKHYKEYIRLKKANEFNI